MIVQPGAAQRGELRLRHQCLPSLAPGSAPRPRRASVHVAGAGCGDFQRADERHAVQREMGVFFFFFGELVGRLDVIIYW